MIRGNMDNMNKALISALPKGHLLMTLQSKQMVELLMKLMDEYVNDQKWVYMYTAVTVM